MLTRNQRAGINAAARGSDFMARTGVTYAGHKVWTSPEIETLRRQYPDYQAMAAALPHRTLSAIKTKTVRLKIARTRRVWAHSEFSSIKPPYAHGVRMAAILPAVPGKSAPQVYSKAASKKVRRPRRRPKLVGFAIVDAIRQRAFDLRLSMTDLDLMLGSKTYFRRPRSENWRLLHRAIVLLGGKVHVVGLE